MTTEIEPQPIDEDTAASPPSPAGAAPDWPPPTHGAPPPPASQECQPEDVHLAGARRRRRPLVPLGIAGLSLVAGAGGGWLAADRHTTTTGGITAAASVAKSSNLDFAGQTLSVADAVSKTSSSVVSIDAKVTQRVGPYQQSGTAAGTGIVFDSSGHVVTNAHVVEGATSITVTLGGDSTPRTATLVGTDAGHDVAVLKVANATGLTPATFGASSSLRVGDQVVAVGNALALEGGLTVTEGIVSALNRSIETNTAKLTGLIQTDAAISSGNSGGALVGAAGQVIGMNTAVAASSGTVNAANIGFAISIDQVRTLATSIIAR